MPNLRLTPEQYRALVSAQQPKLVFGQKPAPIAQPKPARQKQKREDLPENQVESQILGFLRVHGWNIERNQVGTYVPYWAAQKIKEGQPLNHSNVVKIGTKGQCDYTATRPLRGGGPNTVDYFELETKAPGCQPSPEQRLWIEKRRALGYQAVWFDSFDTFKAWYCHNWKT